MKSTYFVEALVVIYFIPITGIFVEDSEQESVEGTGKINSI